MIQEIEAVVDQACEVTVEALHLCGQMGKALPHRGETLSVFFRQAGGEQSQRDGVGSATEGSAQLYLQRIALAAQHATRCGEGFLISQRFIGRAAILAEQGGTRAGQAVARGSQKALLTLEVFEPLCRQLSQVRGRRRVWRRRVHVCSIPRGAA